MGIIESVRETSESPSPRVLSGITVNAVLDIMQKPLETPFFREAEHLQSHERGHLERSAEIIKAGGIIAFPFNGVFGIFGDIDSVQAVDDILIAKGRPRDRKLIQVCLPERSRELVDFSRTPHNEQDVINLWKDVHALGIIAPAATTAPYHLVVREREDFATVLNIWTEYEPLRRMIEHFRKVGGRALVGTSANKSDQPTHWRFDELKEDFRYSLDALVEADFFHLPEIRRRSTTVIDLTSDQPRLHREGNVPEDELKEALRRNGFPELHVPRDVIRVRPRQ